MSTAAYAIRWVGHPVTVVAGLVLVVNDHLLKSVWPGTATGKLSDVAGLVVAPPLLALAVGLAFPRLTARWLAGFAITAVGLGFTLVKLTWIGADVASDVWSLVAGPSRVLRDPTDLVALPALGLAWWTWVRGARRAPVSDLVVARVRALVALPFLLLAVSATSYIEPDAVTAVEEVDGGVMIMVPGTGRLWSATGVDGWRLVPDSRRPRTSGARTQDCVPEDPLHCYRIHRRGTRELPAGGSPIGVEETVDGGLTWRTAWGIPAGRWSFLVRQHDDGIMEPLDLLVSHDILVRLVPGGHQVIVANGLDGLATRDPNGSWRRVGVAVSDPESGVDVQIRPYSLTRFGHGVTVEIAIVTPFVMFAVVVASFTVFWRLRVTASGAVAWLIVAVSGLAISLVWALVLVDFRVQLAPVQTILVMTCVLLVFALAQAAIARSRAMALATACLLVGVAFIGPYLGWTVGYPDDYRAAARLSWTLATLGMVLTFLVAWWAGGRPMPPLRRPPSPVPPLGVPGGALPMPPPVAPGTVPAEEPAPGQSSSGAPSKSTIE